ncbi:zinc-binding dehydrogenase [Conexibacter sp. CPCC 206217]|uniref:zinc-dependent alcohol dehydrogenase n=1 Tax=Conexibacter sp. CPCC 206217 TaxID=3064574 RepID=UPI002728B444|nr:alcohol dehydrogenase catalytic domain-containing protein [Conexibacter sp. CPCC 206217]MDO8213152.1 alcohol dehydrogenase catalytic domain-containing protein [Conexibacter sp. CPCC 206217]
MRAAVTVGPGVVELREVPVPRAPGPGEALLAPEAVGVCGSDLHYFTGELADAAFPRVLGHELAATVTALGPEVDAGLGLAVGSRVAVWPLQACGYCDVCRAGRGNACPNFRLIGIHTDGGLQDALVVPAAQCFPIAAGAALATLAEPLSVAVHAVARGAVGAGEAVVVLGAGPIGQAVGVVALEAGARVLAVDRLAPRLQPSAALGMDTLALHDGVDLVTAARAWAGGDGPPVVFEATGAPAVAADALAIVRPAGRVVLVGLPGDDAAIPLGIITRKELDVLGTSCCTRAEFAAAVDLVERRGDELGRLISGEWPLDDVAGALSWALERPAQTMKLVVRIGEETA